MDLLEIRDKIDLVDEEIVRLFEERMNLCKDVAEFKIKNHKQVLDTEREKQKIEKILKLPKDEAYRQSSGELFRQIMAMSRKMQYKMLAEYGIMKDIEFEETKHLKKQDVKIVYQGVEGAYAHEAALCCFGENADTYHVPSWRDAMEEVKSGKADYAVLPIENSTAGSVTQVYDLLMEYNNYIVGELFLKVEHALIGLSGAKISDIKKVYSHPQALMQSEGYLYRHKDWQQISVSNTAVSVKKVLEDRDITQAAIASKHAAKIYGLNILDEGIQDNNLNTTRFVIVGRDKVYLHGADKISIAFEIAHESGSLYEMLSHFIYNNLNMTKIESRPIEGRNWEYRFFLDFTGKLGDAAVKNALRGIDEEAINFKILGNYTCVMPDEKKSPVAIL